MIDWLLIGEEALAVIIALIAYDYIFDPFLEGIIKITKKVYKKRKKSFIERQGIS